MSAPSGPALTRDEAPVLVLTSTPVVSEPVRELPQPALSDMAGYAAAESIMRSAARARRGDPSMR